MALVLAATGWFLYARLDSQLSAALDRSLRLRAHDLGALVRGRDIGLSTASGTPFVEHGEAFAQLLDAQGRVLDATRPLRSRSLLSPAELRAASQEATFANRDSVRSEGRRVGKAE